jgi:hypothetical protein
MKRLVSRILEHEKALFAENLIMIQMGVPNYNNFLLKNKAEKQGHTKIHKHAAKGPLQLVYMVALRRIKITTLLIH